MVPAHADQMLDQATISNSDMEFSFKEQDSSQKHWNVHLGNPLYGWNPI